MAAKKLNIHACIVMPLCTPAIKWQNVKRLGAEVILYGDDFDEAKAECARICAERKLTNIPPYDDPYVIAGQGTIAVEIMKQHNNGKIDAIFCAVGGGGLISGIACYIKRVFPEIRIIGVETEDANAMYESLREGA
jgi:threonine dehydratase